MDDIGRPPQFFDGFEYAPCEKYGTFIVIGEQFSVFIPNDCFSMEIVFVVDEIDLDAGRRDLSDLNNELMIVVIDDQVHSGESDYFVKLSTSFVNQAVTGHESSDFVTFFLHSLRKRSAQYGHIVFIKIRSYLLADIKDFAVTHYYRIFVKTDTKVLKICEISRD